MKIDKTCRLIGVTVTPFVKDNTPDLDEIYIQTEVLAQSAADGILPCASTGEFVKMDPADRKRVLETVSKANKGQKDLIAGACESSAAGVIQSVNAAKEFNYDACVVCPPYYYGLSQDAVYDFYCQVCEAAEDMPIIGYHVPFFTTGIEIPTYRKLLQIPNYIGMKDSSANMKRISHLCDIAASERPEFMVYTGTDDCLFPALCAGCTGSMTALGASMPMEIAAIYDAFDQGDLEEAMCRQRSILPIIRTADATTFPVGYKLLAKATGLKVTEQFSQEEEILYQIICNQLQSLS